jgi:hypothetical protein
VAEGGVSVVEWLCESCFRDLFPNGHEQTCLGTLVPQSCSVCGGGALKQVAVGSIEKASFVRHYNSRSRETTNMVERNGAGQRPDPYAAPDANMTGWYVVDSIDGRRWLGKIIANYPAGYYDTTACGIPLAPDELVLQPAFEFYPDKLAGAHPVPEQNPLNPQQMRISTQVFQAPLIAFTALLDLAKNGVPPQRVRYAGINVCSDWAADRRREFVRAIRKTLELARPDLPEALVPAQPREKVR